MTRSPTPSEPPTQDPMSATPRNGRASRTLGLLAAAALLVNFIETMLVPALPKLSAFFGNAPYTTVAWVLSAYLVVGVCTTPLFAKLGDLYGKRRILAVVLGVYSVAVGLAPVTPVLGSTLGLTRADSIYLLIGVRGVQGLGLAMFPLALAMVAESLPRHEVAPAQGLIASMFAAGAATGLVGGAWLIQNVGWQFAYATVLPFALVLPLLAIGWLPDSHPGTGGRMDLAGAGLLGGALASLLIGLTLGPSWGWTSLRGGSLFGLSMDVPELFGLAVAFAIAFVWRERTAKEPIIDFDRLRHRNISLSYLGALVVGLGLFTAFVVLTVLVEFPIVGLGDSVLAFGLASIPTTLSMFVAAPLVGKGVARFGPRPFVLLGSALSLAGFLLLLAYHATYVELVVEAVPTFVGLVTVLVSVTNVIALSSHHGETGIHMGMTEMFQDLGASAGPVMVATFLATFTRTISIPPTGAVLSVPSTSAFTWIFAVGAALAGILGVIGVFLRNHRAIEPSTNPAPANSSSFAPEESSPAGTDG
ncbi:MAG TPA: MFS transporter [Thermoplasmata archaeon]|nr:MFS transporter [Thermoplasmata archaeon]